MGWIGTLGALLLLAQSIGDTARELVRDIGSTGSVSLVFRNLSRLPANDLAELRRALERELRGRLDPQAPAELRVTVSENLNGYLLAAELRRGEERRVWILPLPAARPTTAAVAIAKTRLLSSPDPILDVAAAGQDLLVLQLTGVALYGRQNGHWEPRQSAPVPAHAWPRDPRGRLAVRDTGFQAWLPGVTCRGALQPALSLDCRDGEEPWPMPVAATLAAGRNYFEKKPLPLFYAAAPAGDAVVLTAVDGRAYLYRGSQQAGSLPGWGSDAAGLEIQCGTGALALATRPSDSNEADAVQVYQLGDSGAAPAGAPLEIPGPATALWPAAPNTATLVYRDPGTGQYELYVLTISCGN